MKTTILNKIAIAAIAIITFYGCKKDEKPNPTPVTPDIVTSSVAIELEHFWATNMVNFELNKWLVHPKTSDSLKFSTLKYYVSNIKFKKTDGTWWSQPESYHLIDISKNNTIISIDNVPTGSYTDLEFVLGVDSIRNVSGAQTGALSTSNNMFWSWNSGYIMVKAEGESPQSSSNSFAFHLGGFSGANNTVEKMNFNFGTMTMNAALNAKPVVHISANVGKLWHTSPSVSTKSNNTMPNAAAAQMAKDFHSGFSFEHIHN